MTTITYKPIVHRGEKRITATLHYTHGSKKSIENFERLQDKIIRKTMNNKLAQFRLCQFANWRFSVQISKNEYIEKIVDYKPFY